jgi:hypothetical protein
MADISSISENDAHAWAEREREGTENLGLFSNCRQCTRIMNATKYKYRMSIKLVSCMNAQRMA